MKKSSLFWKNFQPLDNQKIQKRAGAAISKHLTGKSQNNSIDQQLWLYCWFSPICELNEALDCTIFLLHWLFFVLCNQEKVPAECLQVNKSWRHKRSQWSCLGSMTTHYQGFWCKIQLNFFRNEQNELWKNWKKISKPMNLPAIYPSKETVSGSMYGYKAENFRR